MEPIVSIVGQNSDFVIDDLDPGSVELVHCTSWSSATVNQTARVSRGRYVLFLNNDTDGRPGWLLALLETAESDPSIGVVGSKLIDSNGRISSAGYGVRENFGGEPVDLFSIYNGFQSDSGFLTGERQVQALALNGMLIRREIFNSVGGLDEQLEPECASVNLCFQVRERGSKVVLQPRSELQVPNGAPFVSSEETRKLSERWSGKLVSDEARIRREDGMIELAQLLEVLRDLRHALHHQRSPKGWKARLPWNLARLEADAALRPQYLGLEAAARLLEKLERQK